MNKKSSNKSLEKYKEFLSGKSSSDKKEVNKKHTDKKVIKVKRKVVSPKIKKKIRDINEIENKMIQMKNNKLDIKVPTQNENNIMKSVEKKPEVEGLDEKKSVEKKPEVKGLDEKKSFRSSKRSRRRSKRSKNKIKGRKVSIKTGVFNKKEIDIVESKIKEIRKKKNEDIKKELKDKGIKVSGKSNRLLKDIYLYSKMCNVNIQYEK
tara:strand:+ start:56 stop:676 length:621 start_codon:yes stop_codon:yes gene_type:complete